MMTKIASCSRVSCETQPWLVIQLIVTDPKQHPQKYPKQAEYPKSIPTSCSYNSLLRIQTSTPKSTPSRWSWRIPRRIPAIRSSYTSGSPSCVTIIDSRAAAAIIWGLVPDRIADKPTSPPRPSCHNRVATNARRPSDSPQPTLPKCKTFFSVLLRSGRKPDLWRVGVSWRP